ncbi:hypothetical protein EAV90_19670 [Bradyrhizobium vignae]|nr:hypothetical protein EAV90_19670 [Bradyrhizobium vignae]
MIAAGRTEGNRNRTEVNRGSGAGAATTGHAVIPRESGVSSTPRLVRISQVSPEYWVARSSQARQWNSELAISHPSSPSARPTPRNWRRRSGRRRAR